MTSLNCGDLLWRDVRLIDRVHKRIVSRSGHKRLIGHGNIDCRNIIAHRLAAERECALNLEARLRVEGGVHVAAHF